MLKRRISAFSLLEMALVLSILGVISAYAIPALLKARVTARWRETDDKLESVTYALAGYAQTQQRLPSPANPTAVGTDAGIEQKDLLTGIIPYRTLGIQESDAKDGFRHWISYTVSQDLIAEPQSEPMEISDSSSSSATNTQNQGNSICYIRPHFIKIDVQNAQDQSMLATGHFDDFIAFVLVAHGSSGAGAFDDAGQRRPAIGDKLKNLNGTTFIDRPITKEYDDRVRWVSRNNLMAMYAKQPCKPIN